MTSARATIIVLEDDPALREMLADGLGDAGYTVVQAATGVRTQQALAETQGPAVLIADRSVDSEGPNGFQIAAAALEQHPGLGVIYISGTHIAIRRRALGPRERALLKPFAMTDLLAMVRELDR